MRNSLLAATWLAGSIVTCSVAVAGCVGIASDAASEGSAGVSSGLHADAGRSTTESSGSGGDGTGSGDDGEGTGDDATGSTGSPGRGAAGDGSGSTGSKGGGGTPSSACTGGGGGGPTGGPGDLFPCDNPWYADVTSASVASDSSSIIGAIGAWGTGKFRIDFSFVVMHADASTPKHTFKVDYEGDSDKDPVPVPPGGMLEEETGYTCTNGGDCHLLVIDDSQHKLFELYAVQDAQSSFTAAQLSVWDLTKHYGPTGRGLGCTSADAAGLAVTPGLIGLRETKAGNIHHALRFILPNSKIRKGPSFVPPATHGTSATSSSGGPMYGMRLRLKPSFDAGKVTSAGGRAIVKALQTYGMMLADGGNYALTAEADVLEKKTDPSMTWDDVLGGDDLTAIQPSDFEVLTYDTPSTVDDCSLGK